MGVVNVWRRSSTTVVLGALVLAGLIGSTATGAARGLVEVQIDVSEGISASDSPTVSPPASLSTAENAAVADAVTVTVMAPTAVSVHSFEARRTRAGVRLGWRTSSEIQVVGFDLYRSRIGGRALKLNRALIRATRTGTVQGASYRFLDKGARVNLRYVYRLELVRPSGARSLAGRLEASF